MKSTAYCVNRRLLEHELCAKGFILLFQHLKVVKIDLKLYSARAYYEMSPKLRYPDLNENGSNCLDTLDMVKAVQRLQTSTTVYKLVLDHSTSSQQPIECLQKMNDDYI